MKPKKIKYWLVFFIGNTKNYSNNDKKLKIEDLLILSQKGDYKALEELVKREQKHILDNLE